MSSGVTRLLSWQVGILAGVSITFVLLVLILKEETIQPYKVHAWVGEPVIRPLTVENRFSQAVMIPESLANGAFLLALYFGSEDGASEGHVTVTLSQGSHSQSQSSTVEAPITTMKERFRFDGFSVGSAQLVVTASKSGAASVPGILFVADGDIPQPIGPGLLGPSTAIIDWFDVIEGSQKLSTGFPSIAISLFWLLPFAGLISLAWVGLGKSVGRVDCD